MWNRRFFQTSALLAAGVSLFALSLAAQDAPSVAEAARRAREQKKASTKPATVITDDTLHPSTATPATPGPNVAPSSAPGQAESAAPAALENTAAAEGAAPSEGAEKAQASSDDAEKKTKVDALKQQIAQAQMRVNMLQREIALAQDNLYRNPDYVHDTAGKEKLASLQDDLQQGQTELADLKAKIADLGGSAEEPKETAPPAVPAPPAQPQP